VGAARLVRDAGVDFHWTFVGDGPLLEALKRDSSDLVDAGVVSWLGYVNNGDVVRRLASDADMLVQPCIPARDGDIDGVPVVLIEAMNLGVPVITTRVSGIPELVTDGVSGFVCEPSDYVAVAERIVLLDRSRVTGRSLGAAGRTKVRELFDEKREVDSLLSHIDSVWLSRHDTAGRAA
jgi:colanic acid/amylovoran biosynthesis glycosyltransferase